MVDLLMPPDPIQVEPEEPIAGKAFSVRAAAYLIDTALMYAVIFGGNFLITNLLPVFLDILLKFFNLAIQFQQSSKVVDYGVGFLVVIAYFVTFEWLASTTPGKLILKMRVIREDGQPCGLKAALVRGLFRLVDGLFLGMVAARTMHAPLQQRLGDRSAKTIVVGSKDPFIKNPRSSRRVLLAAGLVPVLIIFLNAAQLGARISQVDRLIAVDAVRANLQPQDLGSSARLVQNSGKSEVESSDLFDINDRKYQLEDAVVLSRVSIWRFDLDPITDQELRQILSNKLRDWAGNSEMEMMDTASAAVGERAWTMRFSDKTSGISGVGLVFVRKNVLVMMTVCSDTQEIPQADILLPGLTLDERIKTEIFPKPKGMPGL